MVGCRCHWKYKCWCQYLEKIKGTQRFDTIKDLICITVSYTVVLNDGVEQVVFAFHHPLFDIVRSLLTCFPSRGTSLLWIEIFRKILVSTVAVIHYTAFLNPWQRVYWNTELRPRAVHVPPLFKLLPIYLATLLRLYPPSVCLTHRAQTRTLIFRCFPALVKSSWRVI